MHIETKLECLLSRSDFKYETSFGFPSSNYIREVLNYFVKPQNGLVTLVFEKRCFPGDFQAQNRPFELKSFFSKSEAYYARKFSSLTTFLKKNWARTK